MITPLFFVPDASVMLKWAFRSSDEKEGDKALELLNLWLAGGCKFILPGLWVYECGNVLGLKAADTAQEILEIFLGYCFEECAMSASIAATTFRIMRECKVTYYDAAYHAVALEKGASLITADNAYYQKALSQGSIFLLEEYPSIAAPHGQS